MENRKTKLRRNSLLKVIAVFVAVVCIFVDFFAVVLTVICFKNDVYFDGGEQFLQNVTNDIVSLELKLFIADIRNAGPVETVDFPELTELYEKSNYLFVIKDADGQTVYSTADSVQGHTKIKENYPIRISKKTPETHSYMVYYTDISETIAQLKYLISERDFAGHVTISAAPYDFESGVASPYNSDFALFSISEGGEIYCYGDNYSRISNSDAAGTEYIDGKAVVDNQLVDDQYALFDRIEADLSDYDGIARYLMSLFQDHNHNVWFIEDNMIVAPTLQETESASKPADAASDSDILGYYRSEESSEDETSDLYFVKPVHYVINGKASQITAEDMSVDVYVADKPQVVDAYYNREFAVGTISKYAEYYPRLIIVATLLLMPICVYLVMSSGWRNSSEGPSPIWFDKIPFEFFVGAIGVAAYLTVSAYLVFVYRDVLVAYQTERLLDIALAASVPFFAGIAAILTLMTLSTRLKTGCFWKYTIVGTLWNLSLVIVKFLVKVFRSLRLAWKIVLMMAAFIAYNLFIIISYVNRHMYVDLFILAIMFGDLALTVVLMLWCAGFAKIRDYVKKLAGGDLNARLSRDSLFGDLGKCADDLEHVGEGVKIAVDESMRSERLKTELFTNVSHDLKTPLTSIVNYVDILSKDEIESETAREHIDILRRQAARMKKLIEDLVEVSKATSGNTNVNFARTDVGLLMTQTATEYASKFSDCNLDPVINISESKMIANLDGRLMWRVLDNLCGNICKYALPNTRVYITAEESGCWIKLSFKNISKYPLNVTGDELVERFVRGDSSRNTEGSGLGLSIAKSLCTLQNVGFGITIDGDLFKAELTIAKASDDEIMEDDSSVDYDDRPTTFTREHIVASYDDEPEEENSEQKTTEAMLEPASDEIDENN